MKTIKQYLEEFNILDNLFLDQNTDLESIVSEIVLNKNRFEFKFDILFQNSAKNEMILNSEILFKMEQTLNLIFIKEETETNICFANSDEVRSEYKQSFRVIDLLDYIYVFVRSSYYRKTLLIVISSEVALFWNLVKIGANYRKEENK